jgi:hypothetical protein
MEASQELVVRAPVGDGFGGLERLTAGRADASLSHEQQAGLGAWRRAVAAMHPVQSHPFTMLDRLTLARGKGRQALGVGLNGVAATVRLDPSPERVGREAGAAAGGLRGHSGQC